MDRNALIEEIIKNKIIVIIRGLDDIHLIPTVEALIKGGIKACEITFSSSGNPTDNKIGEMISSLVKKFGASIHIGAGTVTNVGQVRIASQAGAEFIISPDTNPVVIKETLKYGLVSIPGCMSPSDIMLAQKSGGDFIKIFPVSAFPVSYIKDLSSPFSGSRFLAVGGINISNAETYMRNGALGLGVGSGIIKKDLIKEERYDEITKIAKEFTFLLSNIENKKI